MARKQIHTYFEIETIAALKKESRRTGAPISEIVRRSVEAYLGVEIKEVAPPSLRIPKPARLVLTDSQKRTIAAIRAAEPGTIMPRQTIADLTAAGEPIEFIELVREEIKLRNDEAVEDTRTPEEIERDNAARAEFLATIDED